MEKYEKSFIMTYFGLLVIDMRNVFLTLDFVWTKTFQKIEV